MNIKGTASTYIITIISTLVALLMMFDLCMGAAATVKSMASNLVPDCTSLQAAPCVVEPVMYDNGTISYDSYIETEPNGFLMLRVTECYVQESCPNHVCVQVKPVYPAAAPSGNTSAHFFLEDAFGKPRSAAGAHTSYMYPGNSPPPPPSRHSDDVERFAPERTGISSTASLKAINTSNYNPTTPWFCSAVQINYTARVEATTGLPPGKKEDMFANCLYNRLYDAQTLGDCRQLRYTCIDCRNYYRNWLCAVLFPRCDPSLTNVTYPEYNASDPTSVGSTGLVPRKVFSILQPCRALCFGVIQTCQSFMGFTCPLTDKRDYSDYPHCNAVGMDEGSNPYAKSIYR